MIGENCGANGTTGTVRRRVLSPFETLFDEMERALHGFPVVGDQAKRASFPVDVYEHEGHYLLVAELPGRSVSDVEIGVDGDVLTITVGAQQAKADTGKVVHRERKLAAGSRKFTLPKEVDAEAIDAEMRNGELVIRVAKRPEKQPKRITVRASEPDAV